MRPPIERRSGGPLLAVAVDLFRHAIQARDVLFVVLLALGILAAMAAFVGQAVVPWTIYPAL